MLPQKNLNPSAPRSAAQMEDDWRWGNNLDADQGGQVSGADANYMPPASGPFQCSNCTYFAAEGQPCQKVADPVQGQGMCSLYEPAGAVAPAAEQNAVAEASGPKQSQSASY